MGFKFNTATVANGLTGIASKLSSTGTSRSSVTLRSVGESVVDLGSALLNALNPNYYTMGDYSIIQNNNLNEYPTGWLTQYVNNAWSENGIIRYMYSNLFQKFMPDISGYTLLFMAPPDLSGYRKLGNANYDIDNGSSLFMNNVTKLCPFLAVNFTPPTVQLNTSTLTNSSGTQHFASKLNITDTMSVSYIENINLDVYSLHSTWLKYIYQVTEGTIEPEEKYLDPENKKIDYAASFYFVKFLPNASDIQYVGKAIGCYPRELSTHEVIGTRSTNESTTVTFTYVVSDYREATLHESNSWLFGELKQAILSKYTSSEIS